jgi:osmotically-inducible protein OsmY
MSGLIASISACSLLPNQFAESPEIEEPSTITAESIVDDNLIERSFRELLEQESEAYNEANINIVVLNGRLLIVGQIPSQALKDTASTLALSIDNVKLVHNELSVGENTSSTIHANDAWISVKVKSSMISTADFPSRKITIVTENGVVYLLGQIEASVVEQATEIAANVEGVQKVVHLFDVINSEE